MSDYGFKIAMPGYDVSSTDPQQLIADSDWDAFKIWKEGNITLNYVANSGNITGSIAHGLNFTPGFMAFATLFSSRAFPLHVHQVGDDDYCSFFAWSDGTNINFKIVVASFSSRYALNTAYSIRYLVFADTTRETGTTTAIPSGNDLGIKVAKKGKDVKSKNIEDLVYTSQYPPMKLVKQGAFSLSHHQTTLNTYTNIAHGMPFVPAFLVLHDLGSGGANWYPSPYNPSAAAPGTYSWSDATNLTISLGGGANGSVTDTWQFRYMIFGERGA